MNNLKKRTIPSRQYILGKIKNNSFLFGLMGIGIVITGHGMIPPYEENMIVFGAAFIIASGVGIYMMLATDNVAKKLHERFNEQNAMLGKQTEILKEMASSLKSIDNKIE